MPPSLMAILSLPSCSGCRARLKPKKWPERKLRRNWPPGMKGAEKVEGGRLPRWVGTFTVAQDRLASEIRGKRQRSRFSATIIARSLAMSVTSKSRTSAFMLLFAVAGLASTGASAITPEVAKKCDLLVAKEFPPREPGNPAAGSAKGTAQDQKDYFY